MEITSDDIMRWKDICLATYEEFFTHLDKYETEDQPKKLLFSRLLEGDSSFMSAEDVDAWKALKARVRALEIEHFGAVGAPVKLSEQHLELAQQADRQELVAELSKAIHAIPAIEQVLMQEFGSIERRVRELCD